MSKEDVKEISQCFIIFGYFFHQASSSRRVGFVMLGRCKLCLGRRLTPPPSLSGVTPLRAHCSLINPFTARVLDGVGNLVEICFWLNLAVKGLTQWGRNHPKAITANNCHCRLLTNVNVLSIHGKMKSKRHKVFDSFRKLSR